MGWLVWMGLARSHKHLLSAVFQSGSSSFSLDLTGQGRSKGVFPASPSLGSLAGSERCFFQTWGQSLGLCPFTQGYGTDKDFHWEHGLVEFRFLWYCRGDE